MKRDIYKSTVYKVVVLLELIVLNLSPKKLYYDIAYISQNRTI